MNQIYQSSDQSFTSQYTYTSRTMSTTEGSKKPVVSIDDLYRKSTQFQVWSFTKSGLEETQRKANERGIERARERLQVQFDKAKKENPPLFELNLQELSMDSIFDPLSFEEEQKYLHFYCEKIISTADYFNMATQVKATAMSFFKKFYLVNSVMEYHPKNILYTCLFLAAKLENNFISIESYCKILPKTEPKDILDLEFIVLLSLKFTLLVHHPFRPLYGFFLDFQAVLLHPSPVMYDVNVDKLGHLYNKAKEWLNKYAIISYVGFMFTPPQIALAAMYDIDKRITNKYLQRKYLREQLDAIKEEQEVDDPEKEEPKEETKTKPSKRGTKVKEEPKDEETIKQEAEQELADAENNLKLESQQRAQYETLVRTIVKCIRIAKSDTETSLQESKDIDKKCFFTLNPAKMLNRKIKKLSSETQGE